MSNWWPDVSDFCENLKDFFIFLGYPPRILSGITWRLQKEPPISNSKITEIIHANYQFLKIQGADLQEKINNVIHANYNFIHIKNRLYTTTCTLVDTGLSSIVDPGLSSIVDS
jgi:hypothetical protein